MGKILIVDDEKEMCSVLSQYFINEGFEVDTAGFCDVDISERVIKAGANNFIAKPFRQKDLFDLMFQSN